MIQASYAAARSAFRRAARLAGYELSRYELAGVRGMDGELLSIDVAAKGTGNQLIVTSGVHGVEGFAGSACQLDCIENLDFAGVRIVFVHAVNPYGFSFMSRTNENRVDLNRNCGSGFSPEFNPEYDAVHEHLEDIFHSASLPDVASVRRRLLETAEQLGDDFLAGAIARGQFRHPDGFYYGGCAREASWHLMDRIVADSCAHERQRTLAIDIHTGLGPSAHGEIIYLGDPADVAYKNATTWLDGVTCPASGDSVTKEVSGSAIDFFVRDDLGEQVSHVGVEFGTRPYHDVLTALCLDTWLRNRSKATKSTAANVRRHVFDAFCGSSTTWEKSVLGRFRRILARAVAALRT